jgi:hypothetical protein
VDALFLIVDGPLVAPGLVDRALEALAILHGPRTVLVALAGPCTRHGRAQVALQAPVDALDLVLLGPVSAHGLVSARPGQEARVVLVV